MDWIWAFWRRGDERESRAERERSATREPDGLDDWEAQLIIEGVSPEWAPRLAAGIEPLHGELGRGSAEPLLRAAAMAVRIQAEAHAEVQRNLRDVKEVERLLGAFSGELEKLDEVLEVLSAYAQRMRAQPAKKPRHTLH